jgi:hypothetical protein
MGDARPNAICGGIDRRVIRFVVPNVVQDLLEFLIGVFHSYLACYKCDLKSAI